MIEPYSDRPETAGSLLVNASTLTSLAKSWSSEGYQVNIHAIGGSYPPPLIQHIATRGGSILSQHTSHITLCDVVPKRRV